jgi:hypothetical protein
MVAVIFGNLAFDGLRAHHPGTCLLLELPGKELRSRPS